MEIYAQVPHPRLRPFIERFTGKNIPQEELVACFPHGNYSLPTSLIRMSFHFSPAIPWLEYQGKKIAHCRQSIRGYQLHPVRYHSDQAVDMFTVAFTPYGFYQLYQVPCSELSELPVALSSILRKEYRCLYEKLCLCSSFSERVVVSESYFSQKIKVDPEVARAAEIRAILHRHPTFGVKELAERTCTTERTLRRFFHRYYGLPPKAYIKLLRLEKTLQQVKRCSHENMLDIALRSGYYDQAHFNHEFKQYIGTSPKNFLDDLPVINPSQTYASTEYK